MYIWIFSLARCIANINVGRKKSPNLGILTYCLESKNRAKSVDTTLMVQKSGSTHLLRSVIYTPIIKPRWLAPNPRWLFDRWVISIHQEIGKGFSTTIFGRFLNRYILRCCIAPTVSFRSKNFHPENLWENPRKIHSMGRAVGLGIPRIPSKI